MVGQATDAKGKYTLIRDVEDLQTGIYDKPLPCFGCGVGWFSWVSLFSFSPRTAHSPFVPFLFSFFHGSFLLGFAFPLMWFYGALLYFGNHYRKDPRERAGLAASAIAVILSHSTS